MQLSLAKTLPQLADANDTHFPRTTFVVYSSGHFGKWTMIHEKGLRRRKKQGPSLWLNNLLDVM